MAREDLRRSVLVTSKFCSELERVVDEALTEAMVAHEYEVQEFYYCLPDSEMIHRYTPDFTFPESPIVIEVKGYWGFDRKERDKYRLVKKQHPEIDLRFVFRDGSIKLHNKTMATYGDWCRKYGFKCADGKIPDEWVLEIVRKQLSACNC